MGSQARKLLRHKAAKLSRQERALVKDLAKYKNDFDRAKFVIEFAKEIGEKMVTAEYQKWERRRNEERKEDRASLWTRIKARING